MIHDFYMFYRMRTKQTFEVKEKKGKEYKYRQFYVKVTIEDEAKTFKKETIIIIGALTPDRAIEHVIEILSKPDVSDIDVTTATKEALESWNKL